ncbi:MAG: flagellin, partial [Pseudolabrys sp.]
SMSNAINTIQAANNGITAITKLVQSQQSLASQALQTTDTNVRATLAAQFDALTTQIAQLAGDSGFNGVNLLAGNTLTVTLDETGNSSTNVVGVDYSTVANVQTNLTIDSAVGAHNSWAASADIQASSGVLTTALTDLRSESQTLSANLSTVQIRQDFTKATINTLQTGSAALTLADSNEEGANLLALQTRQQLSTTALSLASQADQNVLRLFQ